MAFDVLAIVGKALLTGAFSQVAKHGIDGIAEWLRGQAEAAGGQFTSADREQLEHLLADRRSLVEAVVAQFKTVRKSGVTIVGPSGVGKTSLYNYLEGKPIIKPVRSTHERETDAARFISRYIRIVDTPGSPFQVDFVGETLTAVQSDTIDVLVVMLAYGYLDTVGIPDLRRPGRREPFTDREAYLEHALSEEIGWLEDFVSWMKEPERRIPYCMIVVNKMDQWAPDHATVLKHYTTGPVKEAIDKLVKHVGKIDVMPSFHFVACAYNSFKGKAPVGELSAEAAILTLAVLRAEIGRRLADA